MLRPIYKYHVLLLISFLIAFLISCSDNRPYKAFEYPRSFDTERYMGIEPEGDVYGPVQKTREYHCSRFRSNGESITPIRNSCELQEEVEYNRDGYKVRSVTGASTDIWRFNDQGILVEMRSISDMFNLDIIHIQTVRNGRITGYKTNLLRGNRDNQYMYDTKFIYDELGYLTRVEATSTLGSQINKFAVNYRYNRHGNLVEKAIEGESNSRIRHYYSFLGQYKGRKHFDGRELTDDRVSNYSYNDDGQLLAYTVGNRTFEANYNNSGKRTSSRTYVNGRLTGSSGYSYHSNGSLRTVSHYPSRRVMGSDMTDVTHYSNLDAYGNWRLKYTKVGNDFTDITIRDITY